MGNERPNEQPKTPLDIAKQSSIGARNFLNVMVKSSIDRVKVDAKRALTELEKDARTRGSGGVLDRSWQIMDNFAKTLAKETIDVNAEYKKLKDATSQKPDTTVAEAGRAVLGKAGARLKAVDVPSPEENAAADRIEAARKRIEEKDITQDEIDAAEQELAEAESAYDKLIAPRVQREEQAAQERAAQLAKAGGVEDTVVGESRELAPWSTAENPWTTDPETAKALLKNLGEVAMRAGYTEMKDGAVQALESINEAKDQRGVTDILIAFYDQFNIPYSRELPRPFLQPFPFDQIDLSRGQAAAVRESKAAPAPAPEAKTDKIQAAWPKGGIGEKTKIVRTYGDQEANQKVLASVLNVRDGKTGAIIGTAPKDAKIALIDGKVYKVGGVEVTKVEIKTKGGKTKKGFAAVKYLQTIPMVAPPPVPEVADASVSPAPEPKPQAAPESAPELVQIDPKKIMSITRSIKVEGVNLTQGEPVYVLRQTSTSIMVGTLDGAALYLKPGEITGLKFEDKRDVLKGQFQEVARQKHLQESLAWAKRQEAAAHAARRQAGSGTGST